MCTDVSLENNTPLLFCVPGFRHLDCEWVEAFVYNMTAAWAVLELCRFSCITSPFNDLHCTITACGAPPFLFLTFIPHLSSIYFYWPLKSSCLSSAANSVTGCVLSVLSVSAQSEPSPMETWISQASQIHTFHILITHFIFLSPPCSQHDLTTLLPPPKCITASANPAEPLLMLLCAASVS